MPVDIPVLIFVDICEGFLSFFEFVKIKKGFQKKEDLLMRRKTSVRFVDDCFESFDLLGVMKKERGRFFTLIELLVVYSFA